MRIERERFLGAGLCQRTAERRGYANGYKSKRVDTPAGTVAVDVPKTPAMTASRSIRNRWSAAAGRSGP